MLNAPMEASTGLVANSDPFVRMNSDEGESQSLPIESNSGQSRSTRSGYFVSPENFIWYEISMVPEVEAVFVDGVGDVFDVLTVVDEHSEELRNKIYAREAAVIDSLPMYGFDFHVLPRMGHPEAELVNRTRAYRRR